MAGESERGVNERTIKRWRCGWETIGMHIEAHKDAPLGAAAEIDRSSIRRGSAHCRRLVGWVMRVRMRKVACAPRPDCSPPCAAIIVAHCRVWL